nr:hypothetical protein Q903MT_gene336 [Picea sitchensis]
MGTDLWWLIRISKMDFLCTPARSYLWIFHGLLLLNPFINWSFPFVLLNRVGFSTSYWLALVGKCPPP